jgi:hypothetical protein
LRARLSEPNSPPIEKEIALEVLSIIQRIKWKLRGLLPVSFNDEHEHHVKQWLFDGTIPMGLSNFYTNARLRAFGQQLDREISFVPLSFGPQGKPFSLFDTNLWVINPRIEEDAKDFLWSLLSDYFSPETQYELDIRCMESDQINDFTDVFIKGDPRIPYDAEYEKLREDLFACGELQITFPAPPFDSFLLSAGRILLDQDTTPQKEYEYYMNVISTRDDTLSSS